MRVFLFLLLGIGGVTLAMITRKANAADFLPSYDIPLDMGYEYSPVNYDDAVAESWDNFDTPAVNEYANSDSYSIGDFFDFDSLEQQYQQEPSMENALQNSSENVDAFVLAIAQLEANSDYTIINGGCHFSDFTEHPWVIDPKRPKCPKGTSTASGAFQIVVGTWKEGRDALGLRDFSPESQRACARWILEVKRKGSIALIESGDTIGAMKKLRTEWECFDKILVGKYNASSADVVAMLNSSGGSFA